MVVWIAIFAFVILEHPIDSCHNTTFFLRLTGSNVSLWCYFWKYFCLNLFGNMSSSSSQHNIWHRSFGKLTVVEVGCSNSNGLRIKMSFFPSSCRAFRSIPSDLHQLEAQWWISSFILQTSCLEDVTLRITSFRLCKIKRLKVFSPWFPASWARSRSSTNPAFYMDFSPLLDFSGSAGYGTWRIYVSLIWATCRLFSIFLLFWILEHYCLWILLLCLPLSFWDI